MKTTPRQATPIVAHRSVADRCGIAAPLSILLLALLISTEVFQTFDVWKTGLGGNPLQHPRSAALTRT